MDRLAVAIATWFGCGLIPSIYQPAMGGTYGSLAAVPLCFVLLTYGNWQLYIAVTVLIFFVGMWSVPHAERALGPRADWRGTRAHLRPDYARIRRVQDIRHREAAGHPRVRSHEERLRSDDGRRHRRHLRNTVRRRYCVALYVIGRQDINDRGVSTPRFPILQTPWTRRICLARRDYSFWRGGGAQLVLPVRFPLSRPTL